jgi:hypothetical protein
MKPVVQHKKFQLQQSLNSRDFSKNQQWLSQKGLEHPISPHKLVHPV